MVFPRAWEGLAGAGGDFPIKEENMGVARELRVYDGGKSFRSPQIAENAGVFSESGARTPHESLEVTVVMPCLNEAETVAICVQKAIRGLRENNICGEVVIADNGSTDGSQDLARGAGARVVPVEQKGYGRALMGGIASARGKFVFMGDADDSYDFGHVGRFVERLRQGYDLVMGNRFQGGIQPGAMPLHHRYLGNPLLSGIGRLFFGSPCGDFHCGLRGFSREAILKLDLRTTGMEFASEMVVKATLHGLRIAEVPTTLARDGRSRPPHLRSWRDGWRHLRFLLMYSPRWLFLYPGLALFLMGLMIVGWLLPGPRRVGSVVLDVHTMLGGAALILIGFQSVAFAVLAKVFATISGLMPWTPGFRRIFRWITLETGLIAGALLSLGGGFGLCATFYIWNQCGFGPLDPQKTLRWAIPAVTATTLGFQVVLFSFFFSMLGLNQEAACGFDRHAEDKECLRDSLPDRLPGTTVGRRADAA
jgi:glycosyltransferase involved in cell wall biosynthesis